MATKKELVVTNRIADAIHLVRDFMFRLDVGETANLRSQIVTSSTQVVRKQQDRSNRSQFVTGSFKHREIRSRPFAFTEQGVATLSSVLRSEQAVRVNVAIMRAFVHLRATLESNRALERKFSELEQRVGKHDNEIAAILEAIRQLIARPEKPRREIGFHVREETRRYGTRKA